MMHRFVRMNGRACTCSQKANNKLQTYCIPKDLQRSSHHSYPMNSSHCRCSLAFRTWDQSFLNRPIYRTYVRIYVHASATCEIRSLVPRICPLPGFYMRAIAALTMPGPFPPSSTDKCCAGNISHCRSAQILTFYRALEHAILFITPCG